MIEIVLMQIGKLFEKMQEGEKKQNTFLACLHAAVRQT